MAKPRLSAKNIGTWASLGLAALTGIGCATTQGGNTPNYEPTEVAGAADPDVREGKDPEIDAPEVLPAPVATTLADLRGKKLEVIQCEATVPTRRLALSVTNLPSQNLEPLIANSRFVEGGESTDYAYNFYRGLKLDYEYFYEQLKATFGDHQNWPAFESHLRQEYEMIARFVDMFEGDLPYSSLTEDEQGILALGLMGSFFVDPKESLVFTSLSVGANQCFGVPIVLGVDDAGIIEQCEDGDSYIPGCYALDGRRVSLETFDSWEAELKRLFE